LRCRAALQTDISAGLPPAQNSSHVQPHCFLSSVKWEKLTIGHQNVAARTYGSSQGRKRKPLSEDVSECRSRGFVALRSDDPYDAPMLDIGYLTDSEGADMATLR